jgi:hypothetical protein
LAGLQAKNNSRQYAAITRRKRLSISMVLRERRLPLSR